MSNKNMVYHNDVGSENGKYGKYIKNKDDEEIFHPCGNEVKVTKIFQNIETKKIKIFMEFFDITNQFKKVTWDLGDLKTSKIVDLLQYGVQVDHSTAGTLVKFIQNEMQSSEIELVYTGIGWMEYNGQKIFRAQTAVGIEAHYSGSLMLKPKGKYSKWLDMVKNEVLGNYALETALAIGFSATLYGFMHDIMQTESTFFHFCGDSSSGKTTAGLLAISVGSYPDFDKKSLAITWASTENSIFKKLANNFGFPMLIDEASQSFHKNKTPFIYTFTSGSEKNRLNSDTTQNDGGNWATTLISTGEMSWISNASKNTGLLMRIIEFENIEWTVDSGNSNTIKDVIKNNYGHALKKFADGLLLQDKNEICELWNNAVKICEKKIKNDKFSNRLAKKYALIFLSAKLAKRILGIKFNRKEILNFLCENDRINCFEAERDIGKKAFDILLEEVASNPTKFEIENNKSSRRKNAFVKTELWGKIEKSSSEFNENCDMETQTLYILKEKLISIFKKNGFESHNVVLKNWEKSGILKRVESDRLYCRKKIFENGTKVNVYCIDITDY